MFFNSNRAKKMDDIPGKLSVLIPSWIFFFVLFFSDVKHFLTLALTIQASSCPFKLDFFFSIVANIQYVFTYLLIRRLCAARDLRLAL